MLIRNASGAHVALDKGFWGQIVRGLGSRGTRNLKTGAECPSLAQLVEDALGDLFGLSVSVYIYIDTERERERERERQRDRERERERA